MLTWNPFISNEKYNNSASRMIVNILLALSLLVVVNAGERVEILMSNVTTQEEDAYLCTSYKLEDDQKFITDIEPLTNADIAHHMFAYGCEKPASTSKSWNCASVVCQGSKTILFAWGRNAPELRLPDDVAYKVGPNTNYKYIVVNIHYLKKVQNDRSGLAITVSNKARRYQAGIMLLLSSAINLPPKVPKYSTDFSCKYEGKTLNVFAFRVHAHARGDVNAAYRVRDHEWTQMAKGDPQWPQAFYPLDSTQDLKDGDAIVGRCTYHNDENRYITAGSTHNDEMCNVYLMYYTDSIDGVMDICYGNKFPALENIIPADAERKPAPPQTFKNDDGTNKDSVTKYSLIPNWYEEKVANLGQIGGIGINQKSETLVVFHRGNQIWQVDSFDSAYKFNIRKYRIIDTNTIVTINRNTGKVLKSWGSNMFYMPHGLTIDNNGNIWVTDVGRHQVLKFAPNSTVPILEVGERMEPGNDKTHFCQPADVAVLKNGDFFVADGYCNSRIVKFNKNGEYVTEWSSDEQGLMSHFFVPHSLALNEEQNLLCVADRENYRIQCFDLNGNFLFETSSANFGPIYSVAFANKNGSILYAVNGFNSRVDNQFDKKIFLISSKDGKLIGSINLHEDIKTPHDLSISDDASEIYIADLNPAIVFKYALVNYQFGKGDKKKGDNGVKVSIIKDNVNPDDENFKTSIFIMAFLAVPLVAVVVAALVVRMKNTGKLNRLNLANLNGKVDAKGKFSWLRDKTDRRKRNGFTRLNQNSDDEEAQHLNDEKSRNGSSGSGDLKPANEYESDTNSDAENPLPTISKA